jgi:hypothetical protein
MDKVNREKLLLVLYSFYSNVSQFEEVKKSIGDYLYYLFILGSSALFGDEIKKVENESDSLNHYNYCNSNPIKYTDPTGMECDDNWYNPYTGVYEPPSTSSSPSNNTSSPSDSSSSSSSSEERRQEREEKIKEWEDKANKWMDENLSNHWPEAIAAGYTGPFNYRGQEAHYNPITERIEVDQKPSIDFSGRSGIVSNIVYNGLDRAYKQFEDFAKSLHENPWEYGFYGGPGYTGGQHGGVPNFARNPLNSLDALFQIHDLDYYYA